MYRTPSHSTKNARYVSENISAKMTIPMCSNFFLLQVSEIDANDRQGDQGGLVKVSWLRMIALRCRKSEYG